MNGLSKSHAQAAPSFLSRGTMTNAAVAVPIVSVPRRVREDHPILAARHAR